MSAPTPGIYLGAPPEYIETLRRKKETVTRLCAALHEFLTQDIDQIIEQVSRKPPKPPRPTIEDLNAAQEQLDLAHAQLEAIQHMCATMPEQMAAMLRITQMPQIQRWFDDMQARVSVIQRLMEEPDTDSSSPWDGSHRIGTLCAQCARPYDGYATSVPKLKVVLKDAGWGRDADGDHICPGCVAVNSERARLNPQPAAQVGSPVPQISGATTETGTNQQKGDSL